VGRSVVIPTSQPSIVSKSITPTVSSSKKKRKRSKAPKHRENSSIGSSIKKQRPSQDNSSSKHIIFEDDDFVEADNRFDNLIQKGDNNFDLTSPPLSIPPTPDPMIGVPGPWRSDEPIQSAPPPTPQLYPHGSEEQESVSHLLHAWYQW